MAARLKDDRRRVSSIRTVKYDKFIKIVKACDNPPAPTDALVELVAKGRELQRKA